MAEYAQDDHALNLVSLGSKGTRRAELLILRIPVTCFLTGEKSSYGWVKPRHPFDPHIGQWGAFDVAARISNIAAHTRQLDLGFANPSIFEGTRCKIAAGDPSTERLIGRD